MRNVYYEIDTRNLRQQEFELRNHVKFTSIWTRIQSMTSQGQASLAAPKCRLGDLNNYFYLAFSKVQSAMVIGVLQLHTGQAKMLVQLRCTLPGEPGAYNLG